MNIEEIECYKTTDGQIFETEQEAERHQTDLICTMADDFLRSIGVDHATRTYRVMRRLIDNENDARKKLNRLNNLLKEV